MMNDPSVKSSSTRQAWSTTARTSCCCQAPAVPGRNFRRLYRNCEKNRAASRSRTLLRWISSHPFRVGSNWSSPPMPINKRLPLDWGARSSLIAGTHRTNELAPRVESPRQRGLPYRIDPGLKPIGLGVGRECPPVPRNPPTMAGCRDDHVSGRPDRNRRR